MMLLRTSLRTANTYHSASSAGSTPIKKNWSPQLHLLRHFHLSFFIQTYPRLIWNAKNAEECGRKTDLLSSISEWRSMRVRARRKIKRQKPRWKTGCTSETRIPSANNHKLSSSFFFFLSDFQRELSYIHTLCWLYPIEHRYERDVREYRNRYF